MFKTTTNENNDYPIAILEIDGALDRFTYLDLIASVRDLYESGHRDLVIDMNDVHHIELAGFFALYSAAMLFSGEQPLEPVGGLGALYSMADKINDKPAHHLSLLRPQPRVKKALSETGLPVYENLDAALKSFNHK